MGSVIASKLQIAKATLEKHFAQELVDGANEAKHLVSEFILNTILAARTGCEMTDPARPWRFSKRRRAWDGKKRAFISIAKLIQIPTTPSKHSLADLIASLPEKGRRRRLRRLTDQ